MFCPKCGTKVEDGEMFCGQCGAKVEQEASILDPITPAGTPTNAGANYNYNANANAGANYNYGTNQGAGANYNTGANMMYNQALKNTLESVKKANKKTWAIIIGAVVVLILGIVLIATHKKTVNLDKYVIVEYDGYDGSGRATVSLDKRKFINDNEKLKVNVSKLRKYAALTDLDGVLDSLDYGYSADISDIIASQGASVLYSCVNGAGELDKYDQLSNGDEIVYTWDIEEESVIEDLLNCKLKYSDQTFVVDGLEKVETFDPFENIELVYSGMAPDGRLEIDGTQSGYSQGLYYSADKYDGLSNGDVVTITVTHDYSDSEYVNNYGRLPDPLTKTYTVDGLAAYITTSSEIDDDLIEMMQRQAEDVITSNIASNYNYDYYDNQSLDLDSLEYLGYYFLTPKNGSMSSSRVYVVYEATIELTMDVADEGTVTEDLSRYMYVSFNAPMLDTDGTGAVDVSSASLGWKSDNYKTDYKIAGGWGSTYNFNVPGYKDVDEIYNEVVTKNLAQYNHEDNI